MSWGWILVLCLLRMRTEGHSLPRGTVHWWGTVSDFARRDYRCWVAPFITGPAIEIQWHWVWELGVFRWHAALYWWPRVGWGLAYDRLTGWRGWAGRLRPNRTAPNRTDRGRGTPHGNRTAAGRVGTTLLGRST